jgi:acetyl esterase/lipase
VAAQYRLSGEAQWPAQVDDLSALLDWLAQEHQRLGIDLNRIVVLGHSSGAHLALVLAGMRVRDGRKPQVSGLVSFYAPMELRRDGEMLRPFVLEFLGADATEQTYVDASPVTYVASGLPPTLIFHSNADDIVPRQQSIGLYERMVDAGTPVELHMFDRVKHAFDADKGLSRLAVSIVANFIGRYLPAVDRIQTVADPKSETGHSS